MRCAGIFNDDFTTNLLMSLAVKEYGDGAGNTTEENSSVFSLVRMRYLPTVL